jgi:hypothetical protein
MQPVAILVSNMSVREAVNRIRNTIIEIGYDKMSEIVAEQEIEAHQQKFIYLPEKIIRLALLPRIISQAQVVKLTNYCGKLWQDFLVLEQLWYDNVINQAIKFEIDPEELEIARMQPWKGGPAFLSSDGLFSFGSHPE